MTAITHLLPHIFSHEVAFPMCSNTLPPPEANLLPKLFTVCGEVEYEAC